MIAPKSNRTERFACEKREGPQSWPSVHGTITLEFDKDGVGILADGREIHSFNMSNCPVYIAEQWQGLARKRYMNCEIMAAIGEHLLYLLRCRS